MHVNGTGRYGEVMSDATDMLPDKEDSIRFDSIRFDSIQFNSIQFNSIRFDSVRFGKVTYQAEYINTVVGALATEYIKCSFCKPATSQTASALINTLNFSELLALVNLPPAHAKFVLDIQSGAGIAFSSVASTSSLKSAEPFSKDLTNSRFAFKEIRKSEVNIESSIDDFSITMAPTKVISVKMAKQEVEKERILSPACPNGANDVWLSIENAVLVQKSSSADSAHSCKTKCSLITNAGRDCPAITFHEAELQRI
ncbi:unnamed protein product [Toxocara canis]|uniref:Protein kinase domain-containing protein n=1 Tax=Toxocara canis TaxID=6265 RepID=A0A183V1C2_TOXCA|nr:unnamed protein product [Toxocara canis]